jgi:hypothetical protein
MLDGFRPVTIYLCSQRLRYPAQINASYIPSVYGLDKETHPNTLLPLRHGHHKVTRLAINLCFLILRRQGNFKILEERQDYDLHLQNSTNNVNRRLVAQTEGGGDSRELPTNARSSAGR